MTDRLETDERDRLATIADYQWGARAGATLFVGDVAVSRSRTGRIRQVYAVEDADAADTFAEPAARLVTLARDGRFTLGLAGGRRLVEGLDAPRACVSVGDESRPHVSAGKNAFAKFVRTADPSIRPRDEVAVVHTDGSVLAVGRAELDAEAMDAFETGVAVSVRASAGDTEADR